MKAKFIQVGKKMEIRLEDGTIFTSNAKETSKAFTNRVKEEASLAVGDIEIEEVTADNFSKFTVEQLTKAKSNETGLLAELIEVAIDAKTPKTDAPKMNVVGGMSEEAKANIAAQEAAKVAKEAVAKAKEEAAAIKAKAKEEAEKKKAELAAEKQKAKEEAAAAKAAIVKKTVEQVIEEAAIAKANVGHKVLFSPHRTAMKIEGVINGVWVDKRVPMALYRIFDTDGVMYNKTIEASDLEIGEKAPDLKADEKAAKAKLKEEADALKLKNKEEAAAAKVLAKEAADKAKVEAAEKKALEKVEAAKAKAEATAKAAQEKVDAIKAKAELAAKTAADKLAAIQVQVDAPSERNGMPQVNVSK